MTSATCKSPPIPKILEQKPKVTTKVTLKATNETKSMFLFVNTGTIVVLYVAVVSIPSQQIKYSLLTYIH